jgi:hypothetical protein
MVITLAMLSGCAGMRHEPASPDATVSTSPFERAENLLRKGKYEAAVVENQRLLAEKEAASDTALYNIGLISAHPSNPKKDYPRALNAFAALIRLYPSSALVELSRFWIVAIEEHQRILDERQKVIEEKRVLARERESLSQERERLKFIAEKTRQIDLEIEKRRRESLRK